MTTPRIRQHILVLAEAVDAWRVIPRLMLMAYGYLVFNLYLWYKNIPTYVQEKCDGSILSELLAQGKSMSEIKQYACTVVDVVGGPTAAQSTFVTTIIGLSTGIFGLYTATGRKWDGWEPSMPGQGKATVVTYEPTSVMTEDGKILPVGPAAETERKSPAIQIYAAGEGAAEGDVDDADDGTGPRP